MNLNLPIYAMLPVELLPIIFKFHRKWKLLLPRNHKFKFVDISRLIKKQIPIITKYTSFTSYYLELHISIHKHYCFVCSLYIKEPLHNDSFTIQYFISSDNVMYHYYMY
jgi:hypothetical protein